jgi:hypothetical protein
VAIGTTAAIIGGLSLAGTAVSAISSSNAASKAAKVQEQGANLAAQVQREGLTQQQKQFEQTREDALGVYNQSRADLGPYRDVGSNALLALSDQLGIARPAGMESRNTGNPQFNSDPGYKFAFDEGVKAVDARFPGMSRSGSKAKALTQFGQGIADQGYGNWLSRLGSLASVGQTATGQSASLGTGLTNTLANVGNANANAIGNYSANAGTLAENAAAARASGYVGGANAVNNSIGGGVNNLLAMFGSGAFGGINGYGGGTIPIGQSSGPAFGWT